MGFQLRECGLKRHIRQQVPGTGEEPEGQVTGPNGTGTGQETV